MPECPERGSGAAGGFVPYRRRVRAKAPAPAVVPPREKFPQGERRIFMAVLLNGKPVADALYRELELQCGKLRSHGIVPGLGVVRVGEREDDIACEKGLLTRGKSLGIQVERFLLPEDTDEQELIRTLRRISLNPALQGCLLFRTLPGPLDTQAVRSAIAPEKDIDALTPISMGGIYAGMGTGFAPCNATACVELLHYYKIPLSGKKAVVLGKDTAVGLPAALLLMQEGATVSICHSLTDSEDVRRFCLEADIIISAAGRRDLIRADYVKPGQVLVDVGANSGPDGQLHGDAAFDEVEPIVAAITPVPGGVGAVTTTVLLKHLVQAASRGML